MHLQLCLFLFSWKKKIKEKSKREKSEKLYTNVRPSASKALSTWADFKEKAAKNQFQAVTPKHFAPREESAFLYYGRKKCGRTCYSLLNQLVDIDLSVALLDEGNS